MAIEGRNVLIAFVTTSDPVSEKGPAQVLTAVRALRPGHIHLLYTDDTKDKFERTCAAIRQDPDFMRVEIFGHKLENLTDARDYEALAEVLPRKLEEISRKHPGHNFHLVSGHPQVRFVMALCLNSFVLEGVLYDVREPKGSQPEKQESYMERLRPIPMEIFRRLTAQYVRWGIATLRVDLEAEEAYLKDASGEYHKLDLRKRSPERHRTFELLAFLAAKRCFGGAEQEVSRKKLVRLYEGTNESNVLKAIESINRGARRIFGADIIKKVEKGVYRLEMEKDYISFRGNFVKYFEKLGIDVKREFPSYF